MLERPVSPMLDRQGRLIFMRVSDQIIDASRSLSKEDLDRFLAEIENTIPYLEPDEIEKVGKAIQEIEHRGRVERAKTDFLEFAKLIMPEIIFSSTGIHHKMADTYQRMIDGDLKRVIVCMPPRQSKSLFGSVLLPAWFIGKYPTKKIIQASASESLAKDFGRQVKDIISSPAFREIFPGVCLVKESKSNSKFATNHGGIYNAVGTSANVAGLGADLFICDDVTSEQEGLSSNPEIYDAIWNWFLMGPQERLQPRGRILVIQTRWSRGDLVGKLLKRHKADPKSDKYELIKFTALTASGESNFPEFWPTKEVLDKKHNTLPHMWAARYEQDPTAVDGTVVPASAWKKYEKGFVPINESEVEFKLPPGINNVLIMWDTAYTVKKRSNPSAATVWGIFPVYDSLSGLRRNCALLIHSFQKKMEFPELKRKAKELNSIWQPDLVLIEAKNVGPALKTELEQSGLMLQQVNPKPNEDKMSRLVSVCDVFASGNVYYLPTHDNEKTISQLADFPGGDGDDLVDTVAYALRHYRSLGLIGTNNDSRIQPGADMPEKMPDNYAYY